MVIETIYIEEKNILKVQLKWCTVVKWTPDYPDDNLIFTLRNRVGTTIGIGVLHARDLLHSWKDHPSKKEMPGMYRDAIDNWVAEQTGIYSTTRVVSAIQV